jgi:RHS repeat-associated protein
MAGISGRSFHTSESKFKFNEGSEFQNKEFSDGNGLDWYGTDFRGYDPQLGQFRQIDPLAESTDSWGVYSFGFSNPITFNDPLGLTPIEGGCKPCIDGDTRSSGPEPEYKVLPVVEVVAKVKSKSTLANSAFGWANQIQGSGISAWRNDLYGYQRLRDQGLSSAQAGARHQVNAADFERRYQAEQSWRFANYVLLDVLTSFLPLPKLSTARLARSLVATKIVRNPVASSAAKGGSQGGLNLFKWGAEQTGKSTGWKAGDYMLHLPNKGTPALNWKANYGALRSEMNLGRPIFDSYRLPNGNLIPTGGFLNAERFTLQSHGWIYNPGHGAWMPPIK